jgi:hypothetical protein
VLVDETRHLLVEFGDVVFDQSQFLECQFEEPPIDGIEVRARPERVAQLVLRGS